MKYTIYSIVAVENEQYCIKTGKVLQAKKE